MNKTVAAILSTNHAGSHLLAHLMGAHSECFSVGELHRIEKLLNQPNATYDQDERFAGLWHTPPERRHSELFNRFEENTPILIDISKKTSWFERVATDETLSLKFVHLIRDPRALAYRWMHSYTGNDRIRQRLRVSRRLEKPSVAVAPFPLVCAYKWLRENRIISHYLSEKPQLVITYDELVHRPVPTLRKVCTFLGIRFQPEQLNYGAHVSGTFKTDYRALTQQSAIRPDTRWEHGLTTRQKQHIQSNPDVVRYLMTHDIVMEPSGLTRLARPRPVQETPATISSLSRQRRSAASGSTA